MLTKILFILLALGALCEDHDATRVQRIRTRTRTEVSGSRIRGKGEAEEGDREDIVPTRNEAQVQVQMHQYDSPRVVVRECLAMGAWVGMTEDQVLHAHPAPGCMEFHPDTKLCIIHTLKPRYVEDDDRMQNMGHEVLHCFEGAYHTQDGM